MPPYGGWCIPHEISEKMGIDQWDDSKDVRTNPTLIEYVRAYPYGDLALAEIPDDATDWDYWEYDGAERVYYVQNGKIKYCD